MEHFFNKPALVLSLAMVLFFLGLGGCQSSKSQSTTQTAGLDGSNSAQANQDQTTRPSSGSDAGAAEETADSIPLTRVLPTADAIEAPDVKLPSADTLSGVRLEVWVLSVPWGTISDNEAFWKRIDEQVLDVSTHDLLLKNGFRVGMAPLEEWPMFRDLLAKHPATAQQSSALAERRHTLELDARTGIDQQTLFVVQPDNTPTGKTYEQADNILAVSFQRSPARADAARIVVCPVVRETRRRLEAAPDATRTTRLYELNIVAEVPFDRFLILAPSRDIRHPSSIGRNFMVEDGATERMERLLLIVPTGQEYLRSSRQTQVRKNSRSK